MTTQFERDGLGDIVTVLPMVDRLRYQEPINEVDAARLNQKLQDAGSGIPERTDQLAAMIVGEVIPQLTVVIDTDKIRFELSHTEIAGIIAKATKRASAQTAQDIGEALVKSRIVTDGLEELRNQSS